ncbi:argininosuccinate synthase [Peptoniphilus lacydonensis]|mgnify:CR=1 FL=1|uniref:argininosuccinate synthase n=1 Tax=Peptoniphilus lacydonensis TaxID=1673725 RepID=UPI0025901674|nr:argininosuccinate synthase [Peptoniphilus lacydonensis]MBS6611249.1 argininosuccinate synthase [Peptoniphilus harei]MDU5377984.1 argininosuccinate synthase [Peptoniphilus lacydonensis]MDU5437120.1 argininosuccinate synthase [Peptoniphilus lacydonensis]MDU7302962.1 argininosuccinate synthase [Peptoniphilus lacydonensis]
MKNNNYKKVALAYSGGLDTSIIIPWLKENYGCEVIAVVGNVGQTKEIEGLEEKAIKTGASKIYIVDLVEEYVKDFVFPTLKMGAKYEKNYLLGTATARPIIAKALVDIAKKENCDAICHGCTGKGNDQIRFEMGIKHFAPDMPIIAPWRTWDIKSREEEIDYAEAHNIPLKISRETNYSKDLNIMHLSHEGLDLENPGNYPDFDKILELSVSPMKAKDEVCNLEIEFESGEPVAVNGEKMSPANLLKYLNEVGGENGIGIDDIVENRLVGMKSRGVYENPGGAILYKALEILESITLDKDSAHLKDYLAIKFGELVYDGKWYSSSLKGLLAFASEVCKDVSGIVKLKLYKGNIIPAGVTSKNSLYSEDLASFGDGAENLYSHKDADGFINLYSLSTLVDAKVNKGV